MTPPALSFLLWHHYTYISRNFTFRTPQAATTQDWCSQSRNKKTKNLTHFYNITNSMYYLYWNKKKKKNSSTEVMASWHDAPLFLETGVFVSSYAVIVSKTGHCTCFMNPVISLSVHFFCRWGKDILTDLLIMSSLLLWSRNNELWKWDLIARTE